MKIIKIVLIIIAFTIVGFIGGLFVQSPILNIISDGVFTRWRPLGSPPEKITNLLGVGLYSGQRVVYGETDNNQVFRCCPQAIGEWEEAEATAYIYDQECMSLPPKSSPPPGEVKDCVEIAALEWVTDRKQYALLEDGTVWTWHHHISLGTLLSIICISTIIGGIIGILFVWQSERRKHKLQSNQPQSQ